MRKKQGRESILLLFMIVLIIPLCFSACSKRQKEEKKIEKQKQKEKDDNNSDGTYQADFYTVNEKLELVHKIFVDKEQVLFIGSVYEKAKGEKKKRYHTYLLSCLKDGSNAKKIELPLDVSANVNFAAINYSTDGELKIYIVTSGDKKKGMENKSNTGYYFHIFNVKGKEEEVHGLNLIAQEEFYISTNMAFVQEDGSFYNVVGQRIYEFDKNGNQSSVSVFQEQDIYGIVPLTKETAFVLGEAAGSKNVWKLLDLKEKKFGNENYIEDYNFASVIMHSIDENKILLEDSKNIYQFDIESGKITLLFSWMNLGIDGSLFLRDTVDKEGEIFATTVKEEKGQYVPELISIKKEKRTEAEKKVLTLACAFELSEDIRGQLIAFNKTNKKIQIELLDYSGYQDAAIRMNLDIASGKIPDIIYTRNFPVEQFIKKGIFTDLYSLMEQDKEIKKEDFIDSIRSAVEVDKKLYYFSSSFRISALAGSKKLLGDRTSWTIEEMEEIYHNMPEKSVFMQGQRRQWFLRQYLNTQMQDYVKWQTGEVKFDSEAFKKILEFSKNFPDQKEEILEEQDRETAIKQGKVMLEIFQLYDFSEIQVFSQLYKNVGGFTIVPYPSVEKAEILPMEFTGASFGITEQCKDKQSAWQFLRQFLTYDYQKSLSIDESDGFPTRKDVLEKKLEYAQAKKQYKDQDGTVVKPIHSSVGFDGKKIKLRPLNKKEVAVINEMIQRVGISSGYNEGVKDIMDIVMEEVESYYAGDKTVEEVMEIIQNRVKLYVSENS